MAAGMVFAALAFGAATLVEVNVVKTVVEPAPAEQCLLQVFNLAEGNINVGVAGSDLFQDPIPKLQDPPAYETLPLGAPVKELNIDVTFSESKHTCRHTFEEQKAYSLIIYTDITGINCKLVEDYIKKDESGNPNVRFFNTRTEAINITVGETLFYVPPDHSMSPNKSVTRGNYPSVGCSLLSKTCDNLNLGLLDFGASYTFILMEVKVLL
ncbi:hypothetical protein GOODEAATRI_008959 [Goodea atripinnis]|uniref:Uncharacterized protein n=1 Tax=Goodea atripinnis TaxID=208336 RepID=A0ABV0MZZ4_9TELE